MQDKEQKFSRYESDLITYSPILEEHFVGEVMSKQEWEAEVELGENVYHGLKQEMENE